MTSLDQSDHLPVQAGRIDPAAAPAALFEFRLPADEQPCLIGEQGTARPELPDAAQRLRLGRRRRHALDVEQRRRLGQ